MNKEDDRIPTSPKNVNSPHLSQKNSNDRFFTEFNKIRIYHWNCNSLMGKRPYIKEFLRAEKPHLLFLNEIKCKNNEEANLYSRFDDYVPKFKIRKEGGGGGVLVLIHKSISEWCRQIEFPIGTEDEIIGISIQGKYQTFDAHGLYVPPKKNISKNTLEFIKARKNEHLIVGDLNAKMPYLNGRYNHSGKILENQIMEYNLVILNNSKKPTSYRYLHNKNEHAVLDYFLCSPRLANRCQNFRNESRPWLNGGDAVSYFHTPIAIDVMFERNKTSQDNRCPSYQYIKADWSAFKRKLDENCTLITEESSSEDLSKKLVDIIRAAANECIPKSKTTKHKEKLPGYIVGYIKLKNKWARIFQKTKCQIAKENANSLKNSISICISDFKSARWLAFMETLGPRVLSATPVWKKMKRIKDKKSENTVPTITHEGKDYVTEEEKAELFAKKLFNTFNECEDVAFNPEFKNLVDKFITENEYKKSVPNPEPKKFTMDELCNAIRKTNTKKSLDSHGISNFLLKCVTEKYKDNLLTLFNKILKDRKIPVDWKTSQITMITKSSGDPNGLSGYRPISVTACLARLFERMILCRLQEHLRKNNILIKSQSGFRPHRSTQDNLTFASQKIKEATSSNKKIVAIMFDIASAFDKVWHKGLLYKLAQHNTPLYLLELIKDFLTDRTFSVKIGSFETGKYSISCGVPQGAVLSPTLFSVFINDIPAKFDNKKGQHSLLYADDLILLIKFGKSIKKVENIVNSYLKQLEEWSRLWRLKFAPHKCSSTVFAKSKKAMAVKLNFKMYGSNIIEDKSPKFLGFVYDGLLKGHDHLNKIKKTCTSRLNIIRILTHKSWGLKCKTLVQIYKSLIRSIIEYIGLNYYSLGNNQKSELEAIQNNALRTIFKKKREFGNKNLLKIAGVETIRSRMNKLNNIYLQKCQLRKNPIICDLMECYKETVIIESSKGYISGSTLLSQNPFYKRFAKQDNTQI